MKRAILKALELGFVIGFSITGFTLFGYWLDHIFNTTPILVFVGVLLGVLNAFLYLWKWSKDT